MKDKFVAINQFDGDINLLKININNGDGQIISSTDVNEEHISFGLFDFEKRTPAMDFVALLATPEGPVLFFNNLQYRPEVGKTKIKIKDDGSLPHFLVSHEGQHVFGLFYERKFGIGLHPYNKDRKDIDFYFWLCMNIDNPQLYTSYTKEIKYLDQ